MASLSYRELEVLLRLAQRHGRLVHPNVADAAAGAVYDEDVGVVLSLAGYGLVSRPLLALNHDGRGRYRACLAPITERGRALLREAGRAIDPQPELRSC